MPRLVSLSQEAEHRTIDLVENLSVGREPSNSLVLQNKSISAFHCVIEKMADGWQIRDLMSTNGVFINEKRVEQGILRDGDNVRIGKVKFRFELTLAAIGDVGPIRNSNIEPQLPIAAPTRPKPEQESAADAATGGGTKGYGVSGWSPKGPVSRRRAQKQAAASGEKRDNKAVPQTSEPAAPARAQAVRAPVQVPAFALPAEEKSTGRASFALMGLMLLALGAFPFLRVDGPALWFWDCFKEENRPAAMLLLTPFVMGFVIWLAALIAKRLYPFLGGLLVLAAVLATGSLMVKGTTPECLTTTLQGNTRTAAVAEPEGDTVNGGDFVPVTAAEPTGPTEEPVATPAASNRFVRITIPDGATVAAAMETKLLLPSERLPEKIRPYMIGLRIKNLLILQALGLVIMLSMCRAAKCGIGAVLCAMGALIGAAVFIGPLFVPLEDGAMLFGKVFTGLGPATFYAPLLLMAVLCIVSNVSGVLMLRIALIVFWLGIPLCPALTAYLALRSHALIPYLQYVRLLGPLYIVLVLTGWAIGRVILDAGGIPQRICAGICHGVRVGIARAIKPVWTGIRNFAPRIVPLLKKIKLPAHGGRKRMTRYRSTEPTAGSTSPESIPGAAAAGTKPGPVPTTPATPAGPSVTAPTPRAAPAAAGSATPAPASAATPRAAPAPTPAAPAAAPVAAPVVLPPTPVPTPAPAASPARSAAAPPAPGPVPEKPRKAPIKLTIVDD